MIVQRIAAYIHARILCPTRSRTLAFNRKQQEFIETRLHIYIELNLNCGEKGRKNSS